MIALKKILVATDFSEPSDAALAYGRELARTFGAALTVVHVVDEVMSRGYGLDGGVMLSDPQYQVQVEADARRRLNAAIEGEDRAITASACVLVSRSPASAIVSYAGESNIDLIVMGTRGRGGFAHLLMGSVSERVVQTAPCPVLTVRHPEHEFVLPDALVAVAKA